MKKLLSYLLVIIMTLGIIGCSNGEQVSFTSINLKQEYAKEFTPSFVGFSGKITKISAILYNQAIADKIPESEDFESKFEDFSEVKASNDSESDFKLFVYSFGENYRVLSANEFVLKNAKLLYDNGILSKKDYEKDVKESKITKAEYLKELKVDIENIMKYYE